MWTKIILSVLAAMENGRKKEEEYFFEYDNVYNLEHDELRAESASDTSVWYS